MKPQILQHLFLFGCPGVCSSRMSWKTIYNMSTKVLNPKMSTAQCSILNDGAFKLPYFFYPMANSFSYMDGGRQLSSIFGFLENLKVTLLQLEVNNPLIRPGYLPDRMAARGGVLYCWDPPCKNQVVHFTNLRILLNGYFP